MNKKVYKVFNEQVQAELYSAYMYLAMSLDMEAKNYKGMAKWLYLQYEEEREHALRFVKFLCDCVVPYVESLIFTRCGYFADVV